MPNLIEAAPGPERYSQLTPEQIRLLANFYMTKYLRNGQQVADTLASDACELEQLKPGSLFLISYFYISIPDATKLSAEKIDFLSNELTKNPTKTADQLLEKRSEATPNTETGRA